MNPLLIRFLFRLCISMVLLTVILLSIPIFKNDKPAVILTIYIYGFFSLLYYIHSRLK